MDLFGKVRRAVKKLSGVLREDGLMASLECLVRHLGGFLFGISRVGHPRINLLLYRLADLAFDAIHGVDTGGFIDLPEMEGNGRNYVGTPPRAWKLLMRKLPIDPARFTYLDLGCGKGRTLILACRSKFKRVIGVDISNRLLEVARQNLDRMHVAGELLCEDVRELQFPNEPLVIFMYNPFWEDVMRQVAARLDESFRQHPREVYVMYYSAAFPQAWTNAGFRPLHSCTAVYPNYVIYSSGISGGPVHTLSAV